jgi:phenylacetate-CoA ligase
MSERRDLPPGLSPTAQQQVLQQFRRTAATVPFYKRLLAAHRIRPERITDIERFQAAVPIIAKRDVFAAHPLADLVAGGSLDGIEGLITSSGATASSFSLGMIDRNGMQSMVGSIDRLLDLWFQTGKKKTFMITTCAMGVTFPTTLPGSSLSVRSDRALASLRALKPYYQQFVMASDVYFLKKLLEDGRRAGIKWRKWPVQFAMGGEWFPESYRRYLASLLDVDLDQRRPPIRILSSMGAAELGFNLCFETHDTVRLRQLASADERVREALFGAIDTVPMIGHYDPRRWFIELTPTPELGQGGGAFVFTSLAQDAAMPLIRYRTGDCGYVLPHSRVGRILRALNYGEYVPRLRNPLLAVAGRTDQAVTVRGRAIRMEFLRAVLYSDAKLASATTGQFRVAERGGKLHVRIQLQADITPARKATIQSRFSALFNRQFPAVVRVVPYFDFREGLSVDYEQKFRHQGPERLHSE